MATIELKELKLIATSSYKIINDVCVICSEYIDADKPNTKDNIISFGMCGHAYHTSCINKWKETSDLCPIDMKKWVFSNNVNILFNE
jgi:E3 ubiquitin-protein ligase RBX1